MTHRIAAVLALATGALALPGCGVLFAPISYAKAASSNANYVFKGTVVDPEGKPVEGVVAVRSSERTWWDAMSGTASKHNEDYMRVDGDFVMNMRGSNLTVKFSKNTYRDAAYYFHAGNNMEVSSQMGTFANTTDFAVLMIPVNARDAYLAHQSVSISYERYPITDMVAFPNMLNEGSTGDVIYKDKDATDPTVIPDGTLYALVDNAPPKTINQFGKIDPAELDIPDSITLRIAGPDAGFIRMTPKPGLHPMLVSVQAPESGYTPELSLSRERLKEMRLAKNDAVPESDEYFFFRVGDRFGKGVFTWSTRYGKPQFTYDLYLQRRPATRDLTTFNYKKR